MSIPFSIRFKTRAIGPLLAALALGLGLAAAVAGCGGEHAAVAKDEARRAAHVKAAELPDLQVRKLPSGDRVISLESDLYFAFDSAELTAAARRQLREQVLPRVVAFLAKPGAVVELRGYTDGEGTRAYNLRLSGDRAEAARRFLVAAGAPAALLDAQGFGEGQAATEGRDRALRRVDVVLRSGGSR